MPLRAGMVFNLAVGLDGLENADATDVRCLRSSTRRPTDPIGPACRAPLCLSVQSATHSHARAPRTLQQVRGRKYALFLADTLLVKEEGTAEVLTDRAPKAWGDISCAAPLALSHHIGARSTFLRMAEQSRATRRVVASSAVSSPLGCCRRWPLTRPSFAPPAPPWNPPGTT